jgi:hypothetical protein
LACVERKETKDEIYGNCQYLKSGSILEVDIWQRIVSGHVPGQASCSAESLGCSYPQAKKKVQAQGAWQSFSPQKPF